MIMNPSYPSLASLNSAPIAMTQPLPQQTFHNHKLVLRESSGNSASTASTFPMKLHAMLTDSMGGFDDVVCWLPGGQAFKVLDAKRFSEEIMPQYFNQTKYKSFQRQLNIYGFQRVHHGPHMGGYTHKYCVQGHPDLAEQIKREGNSSNAQEIMPLMKWASHEQQQPVNMALPSQQQPLIDPIQPFAWDVEAEAAFGGEEDLFESTVNEIAAFASSMTPDVAEVNVDPTPLPFNTPQQQQQPSRSSFVKRGSITKSNAVLNSDDISFFKNLFQPGDASQEKEILDSFFLEQQQPVVQQQQPQQFFHPAPVQQYQAAVAAAPAPLPVVAPEQAAAAPLLTTAAVSEYNFPRKLYRLLQDCESNPEYRAIVSWSADGKSFKVHCKKRFVSTILPNYFDQTQYASFRRQLNMYSFLRQSMSTYANPYFMRGHKDLLDNVVRKNGNGSTATSNK